MSITLKCEGTGIRTDDKPIKYQWKNRNINGGKWMTIDNSNGKQLVVKNLEQSEQYRCVVHNDVGGKSLSIATISVLSKCMVCMQKTVFLYAFLRNHHSPTRQIIRS